MKLTNALTRELTRDWPEDARPGVAMLWYAAGFWWTTDPVDGTDVVIIATHAAALHEISGLKWLMKYGSVAMFPSHITKEGMVSVVHDGKDYTGPTLLRAISAAVMAVGEGL